MLYLSMPWNAQIMPCRVLYVSLFSELNIVKVKFVFLMEKIELRKPVLT